MFDEVEIRQLDVRHLGLSEFAFSLQILCPLNSARRE